MQRTNTGVMPVSGNTLAKYLVIVSQVIAWFTVSVMLLQRGMNQVNAVPAADDQVGNTTTAAAVAPTAVAGHRESTAAKSLDNSGTPAVVAGVVMIAIAAIMLIVSPVVILMKMMEKRKRRILDVVSNILGNVEKHRLIVIASGVDPALKNGRRWYFIGVSKGA